MTGNAFVEVLDADAPAKLLLELKVREMFGVRHVGELGGYVHVTVGCLPTAVDVLREIVKSRTVFSMCVFYPSADGSDIEEAFELMGCQFEGMQTCDRTLPNPSVRENVFHLSLNVRGKLSGAQMSERGRESHQRAREACEIMANVEK